MNTQKAIPVTVNHLLGAIAGILLMFTLLLTAELVKDHPVVSKSDKSSNIEAVQAKKTKSKTSKVDGELSQK